jgi:hypothetical protein
MLHCIARVTVRSSAAGKNGPSDTHSKSTANPQLFPDALKICRNNVTMCLEFCKS